MINIILLSNGSNIMAEEIAREINVKKREGKKTKQNKKNTDLSLKSRRKQLYGAVLPNIE